MFLLSNIFKLFFAIFVLAASIAAILAPFFVFRIRNELIYLNKQITELIKLQGGKPPVNQFDENREILAGRKPMKR